MTTLQWRQLTTLQWRQHSKRAWLAPDGKGGHYHVEKFLRAWVLVHTARDHTTTAVKWPPGMKAKEHNLENAQAVCQDHANGK